VTIEIELDGARRQVTLRREGDRWIAGIDGREVAVSVAETGGQWSMLVGPPSAFARSATADKEGGHYESFDIAFEPVATGELIVHVNGVAVPLTVVNEPGPPKPWAKAARARHGIRDGGAAEGPLAIVAPMPGRIVKVLVKLNETVVARQPLVVVEAMKMENELRAPRGGIVAEVRVAEGASVEANTVLVVLR
jgi:biotin carboxyl carrier protein